MSGESAQHFAARVGSYAITSISIVFVGLLLYSLLRMLYNVFLHPLHEYPGPLLWRATSLPYDYYSFRGETPFKLRDIHKKYGDIVRISPVEISYANEQAVKDIWAHKPGIEEFPKHPRRRQLPPNGIENILGANKEDHARYRRLLAHAFSEKGMRDQEPLIRKYVDLLIDRLQEQAGKVTDMVEWYNRITFDMIGDLAFGDPFYCLQDRKTHPWVKHVPKNVQYSLQVRVLHEWGLGFLNRYLIPQDVLEGRAENYRLSEDKLNRRIDFGGERGDFWDRVMMKSADGNKTGTGMTHGEMLNNASVLVLGGSDTTATTLSATTYLLLNHLAVYEKVKQEIRTTFTDTSEITLFSVSQLKYMLAVLDEAMRIYPPVPQPAIRTTPAGGGTVCGKHVPEGCAVAIHVMGACAMSTHFRRPDEFIPERFLDGAKEEGEFSHDHRGVLQPFSVGTRNCIGKNLAYAEMRLVLAKVLFHFDMSLEAEQTGDWFAKNRAWGVWSKEPLFVKISPREK